MRVFVRLLSFVLVSLVLLSGCVTNKQSKTRLELPVKFSPTSFGTECKEINK